MRSRARLTRRPRPRAVFRHSSSTRDRNRNRNRNTNTDRSINDGMETVSVSSSSSQVGGGGDVALEPSVPSLFTSAPPIRDGLETPSSQVQDATLDECLPFLTGYELDGCNAHGLPHLDRRRHISFLHKQLGKLPAAFTPADPSRPWFFYWCLAALTLLGEDVSPYRQRLIDTVRPMQDALGGFAGGFGQTPHLATTYATVLSLALVGGDDAYDVVDRRAMWRWLCSLKQPDGGFQMALGGEEDVRGAYCAAVIISLLNIPLDLSPDSLACSAGHTGLFTGLAEYYAPEGGFSGRTNKLVDGCYSHWVGGCWPLIEAALNGPRGAPADSGDHPLPNAMDSLFSRDGLTRYILSCCQDQSKRGGMRDKPSKYGHPPPPIHPSIHFVAQVGVLTQSRPFRYSDAYHTCYVLSGLSSAQHKWDLVTARAHESIMAGDSWTVSPYMEGEQIFDEEDRVSTMHPVYVIPQHKVDEVQSYFASKTGF
ncbi:CAAX farnesyltransferase (FTase) subunit beta [Neonectria punicea]|uniref:CAAX farnesyltransferase (FTase) subunit beta n=1 Tax=Neonectria punicea TaxID=979145 RepID=A0ABR1GTU9_9HYPO